MKLFVFVIFILIALLGIHLVGGARGGGARGGGGVRARGGGTRGGGTRSGGSRSPTRFSTRANYGGSSYRPGTWKTAAAVGTLYGLSSYKRRRRYIDSPDSEPTVCFNEKNLKNGTYGYFICPEEGQSDDMAYCCGDENAQTCCEYADATAVGRIIGIVCGVLAAAVIVGVVVYCVFIKLRKNKRQKNTTMYSQSQSAATTTVQYSTNQAYSTPGTDFQYGKKQDLSSYEPNTYDTLDNSAVNGAPPYSSGSIGFEGAKFSQPQSDVSGPPPYPTTPYTGFQDTPSIPPPAYTTNNI